MLTAKFGWFWFFFPPLYMSDLGIPAGEQPYKKLTPPPFPPNAFPWSREGDINNIQSKQKGDHLEGG